MVLSSKSEKTGIVFEVRRFTLHDGPGIRTTVFLKGCHLSCLWCHNPESMKAEHEVLFYENRCIKCGECVRVCHNEVHEIVDGERRIRKELCRVCGECVNACPVEALALCGKQMTVSEVAEEVEKDRVFYEKSKGGVTISGGEPMFQPEFTIEILKECKRRKLHTVLDTSGYIKWEVLEKALDWTDLILYDIKHMDRGKHKEYTGVHNDLILDNLKRVVKRRIPVNIRFPLIPGYNNSEKNLKAMAKFLKKLGIDEVEILPYNKLAESKWKSAIMGYRLQGLNRQSEREIERVKDIIKSEGVEPYLIHSPLPGNKVKKKETFSPRIKRLKERLIRHEGIVPEWTILMYQSLKKSEGKPMILRRAEAFAYLLESLPIGMDDDELLVGRFLKRVPTFEKEKLLEDARKYLSSPEINVLATSEYLKMAKYESQGLFSVTWCLHHVAPNARKLLELGWEGIAKEIEERLRNKKSLNEKENLFLEASLLTVRSCSHFIQRYAKLARDKIGSERKKTRQLELKMIEKVCQKIATKPPATFYEAIQLIWFQYFLMNAEISDHFHASSIGQLDRYLIDFYRKDLKDGRITREQVKELIQNLFLAMNIPNQRDLILPVTVGGIGPKEDDASNELTEICLEAVESLNLLHPSIGLRYHRKIPLNLMKKAVQMWRSGSGYPQVFNDAVVLPSLLNSEISPEDIYEWTHSVCTEITVIGKTNAWISNPYFNMAKPLELILNNGRSLLTGERIGEDRGNLTDYKDFKGFYNAYLEEVRRWIKVSVDVHNRIEELFKEILPHPFLSSIVNDCIQKARDYTDGGARYNPSYIQATGISTVVDSLVVLRDLILSRQRVSADEFLDVLKHNFEGYSELHSLVRNYPKKYGNDIPEVDELFVQIAQFFYDEVRKYHNTRGGRYYPGFMVWQSHMFLGENTGATPDGRLAGTALSDSVGAVQGMDRKGLTALFKSVTKNNFIPCVGGVTFNVRLLPSLFSQVEKIINTVETYFELGGFQIQVNVVDSSMLKGARIHPEKYQNLMVRVGGFSAYFTTLSPIIQDEIIARTEHFG